MSPMDATPMLLRVAKALRAAKLEAILIGNAAAALQGAPVTTLDLDFMFRDTPTNMRKLKVFAKTLRASIFRPYYPVSRMFRVINDDTGLQVDFLPSIHGVRSFEGLRRNAIEVSFGDEVLAVADLADIVKSKAAAGRAKDRASLPILRLTLKERNGGKP